MKKDLISKKEKEKDLILSFAKYDDFLEHEDNCGLCFHKQCMTNAAKQIIESGDFKDALSRWDKIVKQLWQEGKYFKLYTEEKNAGRDPHLAFEEKGWEM